jgi:beta-xylosidase
MAALAASEPKPAPWKTAWGEQGDGTFVNPVLPADYSDTDVIGVGDDFYAISSTFQFSPGVVVLHSQDLVNWSVLSHAVRDLTQIAPQHNWDKMDRYGRGIWAGAIRFHGGRYWIYFGTPDEGFFMTSAANPAGPWEKLTPVMQAKGWDDCCPFWDDDGQGYLVGTNFSDNYKIHLFKMTADGAHLIPDSDRVIHQSRGSEANKLYKINGMYYHYFSEVKAEGRVAMMERAKSLDGPWEIRQLNHVNKAVDKEPNQGGLVQLASGEWWFLTHQGDGDWEGRALCLLPVTWTDGWPLIGKVGADGIGNMVWNAPMPNIKGVGAAPRGGLRAVDEFDAKTLGPEWEWNYQPRAEKWSLEERPGFLRLHAFEPLKAGDLLKAGNTLTRRVLRSAAGEAVVKLDISGMADGQQAGLCHLARAYSMLGVTQAGGTRTLAFSTGGKTSDAVAITGTALWLKTSWDFDGKSQFAYSIDGKTFASIGPPCQLTWSYYRGDRLGIYCFNDKADAGHVDVDAFETTFKR